MRIDGQGSVLVCRVDGDPAGLLETLRRSRSLLGALRAAVPMLIRAGIRVEVRAGALNVGRLGSGVKQNALGRLLRLPATHVGA